MSKCRNVFSVTEIISSHMNRPLNKLITSHCINLNMSHIIQYIAGDAYQNLLLRKKDFEKLAMSGARSICA